MKHSQSRIDSHWKFPLYAKLSSLCARARARVYIWRERERGRERENLRGQKYKIKRIYLNKEGRCLSLHSGSAVSHKWIRAVRFQRNESDGCGCWNVSKSLILFSKSGIPWKKPGTKIKMSRADTVTEVADEGLMNGLHVWKVVRIVEWICNCVARASSFHQRFRKI